MNLVRRQIWGWGDPIIIAHYVFYINTVHFVVAGSLGVGRAGLEVIVTCEGFVDCLKIIIQLDHARLAQVRWLFFKWH